MAAGQACTSRSFAANGCWRPSSAQRRCVPSKKPLLVSPAAPSASASLASEPLAAPPASASPPALSRTPRFKPWFEQLETQLLDMGLEVVRTTTGERLDDDAADADDDQIATELERKQRELGTSACQVQHLEDVRRLGGSFGKLQQLIHQDLLTQMPSDPEALFLAASSFFIARRFRESLPLMQASMMAASEGHLSKKALAARHYFLALIALRLIMESDVSPQGEGTTRKVALDGLSEARKHELCTIVEQGLRESLRLDPRASSAYIDAELLAQIRHPGDAHARVRLHAELVSAACVSRGFWVHPLQRPMHFYPKLRSQPWWDAEQFSWASTLRSHFDEIRREVLHMRGLRADGTPYEWDQVGSKHDAGDRELVEDGECTFSALGGGAHLKPHCGSTNARLTCHLPLLCPSGSSIRCGDEERAYQEGELLVFDDSWEHEVWQRNQPDSVRVVLLIRFWHPDIPPPRYPEVHHHMKKAYLQHKRRILLPPLQRVTEESSRP